MKEMLSLHFGAHSGSSMCRSCSPSSICKKFNTYLTTLYYFTNSPVQEAAFHHMQTLLMDPTLQLKKAVHTRWLSHDQAITVLLHTLPSMITTLEREVTENDEAVAHGLFHEIKTYNFIVCLESYPTESCLSNTADVDLLLISPKCHLQLHQWSHNNNKGPHLQ